MSHSGDIKTLIEMLSTISSDGGVHGPEYIFLRPGRPLPSLLRNRPFKSVIVIEAEVTRAWRQEVSDWLVAAGCRYMMAWGKDCSSWDDSVDLASETYNDSNAVSECVMTTWHEQEVIAEVFWFSQNGAVHPSLELEDTCLIHIADTGNVEELLRLFQQGADR